MIRSTYTIAITVMLAGCHVLPFSSRRIEPIGPPLPMNVSCDELVQRLNQQSNNLKSWQSTDIRLKVDLPGAPPLPAMKGNIACESPNRFHLTARNAFATANMGANSERCWFLSTPGHHGVISWHHDDAHLLQEFPTPVPYIDPDWLMLVLGVKQLDPNDYVLEPPSDPRTKELWLTSLQRNQGNGAYRYVIKVSTETRVIREHAAYDKDHRLIVRAVLSNHQMFDGHLIPRTVQIEIPSSETSLELTFSRIETDPVIASSMWEVPSIPGGDNVDLGQLITGMRRAEQQKRWNPGTSKHVSLGAPQFHPVTEVAHTLVEPDWAEDEVPEEPNWDDSEDDSSFYGRTPRSAPRRRFLGIFPIPWQSR